MKKKRRKCLNSGEGRGSGDNLTSCWLYKISQCFFFTWLNVPLTVNHCNLHAWGWRQGTAYMQFRFYSLKRVTRFPLHRHLFLSISLVYTLGHAQTRACTSPHSPPPRWHPWGGSYISRRETEAQRARSEMDCKVLGLSDTCSSSNSH